MKKLTAGFCAIALAAVPTAQVMAAPSIGTSGPKDPVVEEGALDLKEGEKLVIKEVTPDQYADAEVADVVTNFNDEDKVTTALEVNNSVQLQVSDVKAEAPELAEGETIVVKDLGRVEYENKDVETAVKAFNEKFGTFEIHTDKDGENKTYVSTTKTVADFVKELKEALKTDDAADESTEVTTNKDTKIDLSEYKAVFGFADMLVDDTEALQVKETGEFQLTMTFDALKGMKAEDLVFVVVNTEDGTISYIEPDEFDEETGEITGTFEHVGPFTIATKGELEDEVQMTNKGSEILPQQYEALTSFVDLAIEDLDSISYDMDGNVQVKFTCELTVDMDAEDIVLLTIDPETKAKEYLELDEFDEKTGEITATFENLGPFVVLTKVIPDEDITVIDEEEETSEAESVEAEAETAEAQTVEAATEAETEEATSEAATK